MLKIYSFTVEADDSDQAVLSQRTQYVAQTVYIILANFVATRERWIDQQP
jgi:hypothetical protein